MFQKPQTLKKITLTAICSIAIFSNYSYSQKSATERLDPIKFSTNIESNHSTIFVHGTLFGFSWLVRLFECPLGLSTATAEPDGFVLGKIPHILNQVAPTMFPLNKFYHWGWHGELCFKARKATSHELYHALKRLPDQKTIIGQSHGCNVALNLAKIAQEHHDKDFVIDRLILLTGPVQEATAHLVESPIFKKVFSLYSSEDLIQILDPQGLYKVTKKHNTNPKLFSEKTFKPAPNLVQAEIIIDNKSPSHMDFLKEKFIKHLPDIIELLDTATQNTTDYAKFHYKINIPLIGKPHFVTQYNNGA